MAKYIKNCEMTELDRNFYRNAYEDSMNKQKSEGLQIDSVILAFAAGAFAGAIITNVVKN